VSLEIAVIIPAYNRAHLIAETLTAVLQQTLPPAEIIVVDDGSTDDTGSVVASFGHRVRCHRIRNAGVTVARNHGVAQSRSRWLAFCDSDDIWRPDHLAAHAFLRQAVPQIDYAFSNFRIVKDGDWQARTKFDDAPAGYFDAHRQCIDEDHWYHSTSLYGNLIAFQCVFPSTIMMSRQFFDAVGGWRNAMSRQVCEDFEMALRCVMHPPVGVIGRPTVGIRKHRDNHSADMLAMLLGDCAILEHAKRHHRPDEALIAAIDASIASRRQQALRFAFTSGDLAVLRDLYRLMPDGSRTAADAMKYMVASLPRPVAGPVATILRACGSARGHLARNARKHQRSA
jgi:hypothetical protein